MSLYSEKFNIIIKELLEIGDINIEDINSVHKCIHVLQKFHREIEDFLKYECILLSEFELKHAMFDPHLIEVQNIFAQSINDLIRYEGRSLFKAACSLKVCYRLVAFFLSYINDYNRSAGMPDCIEDIIQLMNLQI